MKGRANRILPIKHAAFSLRSVTGSVSLCCTSESSGKKFPNAGGAFIALKSGAKVNLR